MKNIDTLKYYYQKLILNDLPEGIKTQVFIAGGAIRDYLSNADIKDIDLFTTSKEVEIQLLNFFDEKGKLINKNDFLANYTYKNRWFQVILNKHYSNHSDLIGSFDFTICQAVVFVELELFPEANRKQFNIVFDSSVNFFQDTLAKHLRVNKITFPLSTLERMQKYIQKGYIACNGTLLEIARSLKDLDLNNPADNVLQFYPNGHPRFIGVD